MTRSAKEQLEEALERLQAVSVSEAFSSYHPKKIISLYDHLDREVRNHLMLVNRITIETLGKESVPPPIPIDQFEDPHSSGVLSLASSINQATDAVRSLSIEVEKLRNEKSELEVLSKKIISASEALQQSVLSFTGPAGSPPSRPLPPLPRRVSSKKGSIRSSSVSQITPRMALLTKIEESGTKTHPFPVTPSQIPLRRSKSSPMLPEEESM